MEHSVKLVYDKLRYVYDHSGDGAIIHEAGHLSDIINSYNNLVEKETANPIMGPKAIDHYKSQLAKFTKEGEEFLK